MQASKIRRRLFGSIGWQNPWISWPCVKKDSYSLWLTRSNIYFACIAKVHPIVQFKCHLILGNDSLLRLGLSKLIEFLNWYPYQPRILILSWCLSHTGMRCITKLTFHWTDWERLCRIWKQEKDNSAFTDHFGELFEFFWNI